MEESHVHDIARVIQLALAPAFLLTGVASLLNVFANRLARIVDRTRVLEVRVEPGGDDPAELEILRRRGELVRWAITMGTGAALFVTLVIGFAFLGFLLKVNFAMGVAGLFVAAMAALTLALGLFLREVTLAVGSLEAFLPSAIRRERRQRQADEGPGPLGGG
jgi:small-conductance mechanosensitive channel